MKISEAVFVKSASGPGQYPREPLPEIAFSGRSNVGKSSMLNRLVERKSLARTSSTPGRTRLINFYRVNKSYSFADLPGYGYARVSAQMRQSWKGMVEEYLERRGQLKLVIIIIDLRRGLEEDEAGFMRWLKERGIKSLLVATKSDKLSRSDQIRAAGELKERARAFGIEFEEFSALTGLGRDRIWRHIVQACAGPG